MKMTQKEFGIAIKCCIICGSWIELPMDYHESNARIYICEDCKKAIEWAKEQARKESEKEVI